MAGFSTLESAFLSPVGTLKPGVDESNREESYPPNVRLPRTGGWPERCKSIVWNAYMPFTYGIWRPLYTHRTNLV